MGRFKLLAWPAGLAAALLTAALPAPADVIIQQQSTFDFSVIKAHGTTTESTSADKQRRDTELHCEGFMALFCGNAQSADIVRLDRDLTWALDPKKREYRETPFSTPEQRQAAAQHAQEVLEKLQQCPAMRTQNAAPDTSKCDMSPPKIDVKNTDTHASIAGHDAKLTQLAMTRSCRNRDTGDTCDFMVLLDSWLTQDSIEGLDEHKAFQMQHLQKLGLDPNDQLVQDRMKQFLAPYQDSLKAVADKSAGMKGYPLKTSIRIAFGGEHCAAAKQQQGDGTVTSAGQAAGDAAAGASASAAGGAAGAAAANAAGNSAGGSILGSAASAFGSKLVSGLFAKKKQEQAAAAAAGNGPGNPLPPGMFQAAQITLETTSISSTPVPAAQFEIPTGYKLVTPKERKEREVTCPQPGSS
ncbi:MAG: hypothetical protein JOZ67_06105 [Gammaproteobacteria bacterium]|nr:hypothetical protein [Gammaproteobacteria bacterium]MBV9697077.1 hypothetical protein [Gammaproteobacteria bacterium]